LIAMQISAEDPGLAASGTRLSARAINFSRHQREVLKGIDIEIGPGEIVSLLGANGAGKTTLLRILLGLMAPSSGDVMLDDKPLGTIARRHIAQRLAYVPQVHTTPFPYTVKQVALMGRLPQTSLLASPSRRDFEVVGNVLERLRIAHLADRVYSEISGGERQLTLIARALVQEARIIVLDEPMANLDLGYQGGLCHHLRALAGVGHTILMSGHDPQLAYQISTRIAVLIDGRLEQDGPPSDVMTAETIRRLYGIDIEIVPLPGDRRAFVFG